MSLQRLFGPIHLLKNNDVNKLKEEIQIRFPQSWPNNYFFNLPHSKYLYDIASAFSDYANGLLHGDVEVERKEKAIIFVCLTYSNKANSQITEFKCELEDYDFSKVYILFFETRFIYEVLAVLLFSPIVKKNRPLDGAFNSINLAMASRLIEYHNVDLDRIALGLTAKNGTMLVKVEDQNELPFNFFTILSNSNLSENEILNLIWITSQFVLGHELAHILYKSHPQVKEYTEHYFDNMLTWLNWLHG